MLKKRIVELARTANLGSVTFESKQAQNYPYKRFTVGYVHDTAGRRTLFCKSRSGQPDCFYLCNEYEKLAEDESKASRL